MGLVAALVGRLDMGVDWGLDKGLTKLSDGLKGSDVLGVGLCGQGVPPLDCVANGAKGISNSLLLP